MLFAGKSKMLSKIILLMVVDLVHGQSPNGYKFNYDSKISDSVQEDAKLDTIGLLNKYGYPNELHTVETEDGYILKVHRIPHAPLQIMLPLRPVVILMHGLLGSSADWILAGPDNALGYLLAQRGFDVWMANARGNFYSRTHKTLDPNTDSQYWDFSFHEIGYYDIPAIINYIFTRTGNSQVGFVGHSQGATAFFVMCSERPEYNLKIKEMHALAPVAFLCRTKSPILRQISFDFNINQAWKTQIGATELLPTREFMAGAGLVVCGERHLTQSLCQNFIFLLFGFNPVNINKTLIPIIMGQVPAGSSSRQLVHFSQLVRTSKFRKFDYLIAKNINEYGSAIPPEYFLNKVSCPVTVHFSVNDIISDIKDVDKLCLSIGSAVLKQKVESNDFNHLDFLFASSAKTLLYDYIINAMRSSCGMIL